MTQRQIEVPRKQIIVPTGERMGYLAAREAVRDNGGLPSNVLHDDTLVYSDAWKALRRIGYYAAWAREVLVYPSTYGKFRKGKDAVDAFRDRSGREWIFPASSIPQEALERAKVGLFVDPQHIEVGDKRVVVESEPQLVVVLSLFRQNQGQRGKVDERTRVPLEVPHDAAYYGLPEDQVRWLWRTGGVGVRPLAREGLPNRQVVGAAWGQDSRLGVASVQLAGIKRSD
ncbi:MAG: hypothetical protein KGH72_00865 [Candidatus Micrarchaeota archaeon]|nr:hypothetical protein [Candidatus Micrarchaeota archaeon]